MKHMLETSANKENKRINGPSLRENLHIFIIIIIIIIIKSLTTEIQRMQNMRCYDCTGNNWSHRNSNKRFKEQFGSSTGRTFNRFSTKDSCTWNSTHNTGGDAV